MANYNTLKTSIEAVIKQNGNNEITGPILQQTLLAMVNSLGANYQYAGIATPTTNPGTPDQNVFYLASTAGTYTNFGGLVLADGEIAILKYNGAWSKDSTGAASLKKLNQLGQQLDGNYIGGKALYTSGLVDNQDWGVSVYIPYTQGNGVEWKFGGGQSSYVLQFYDASRTPINNGYWGAQGSDGKRIITASEISQYAANAAYLRASFRLNYIQDAYVKIGENVAWTPLMGLIPRVDSLEQKSQGYDKLFARLPYVSFSQIPIIIEQTGTGNQQVLIDFTALTNNFYAYYNNASQTIEVNINPSTAFSDTGKQVVLSTYNSLFYDLTTGKFVVAGGLFRDNSLLFAFCEHGKINGGLLVNPLFRQYSRSDNSVGSLYLSDTELKKYLLNANYVARYKSGNNKKGLTFLWLSDIHGFSRQLKRIIEFHKFENSYFADILHSGDSVSSEFNDGINFISEEPDAHLMLNTIGNHDTATKDGNIYDWWAKSSLDCYNQYFAPFISGWGVVQPENAATLGRCYYYKDYADSYIRLVTLDAMVTNPDKPNYDASQITWFADVLNDAKNNGLQVIVNAHFPPSYTKAPSNFTGSLYGALGNTYGNMAPFASAINDFVIAGGTFIAWLCGDVHCDDFGHITAYPNQVVIRTAAATPSSGDIDMYRLNNTPLMDCFNVLSINPNRKIIKLKRIGANVDMDFRGHNVLSYDYGNNQLITSY